MYSMQEEVQKCVAACLKKPFFYNFCGGSLWMFSFTSPTQWSLFWLKVIHIVINNLFGEWLKRKDLFICFGQKLSFKTEIWNCEQISLEPLRTDDRPYFQLTPFYLNSPLTPDGSNTNVTASEHTNSNPAANTSEVRGDLLLSCVSGETRKSACLQRSHMKIFYLLSNC